MTPRVIRVQRRGKAGPSLPGTVDLYFDAQLRQWRYVDEGGNTYALASGGVSSHTALTSLAWSASGHTGTASWIAGFNGAGAAAYYQIGADLQAYDAGLTSLAAADGSAGLPYVTAANTWAAATLGDLAVSGGAWEVTQARGLRETSGPTTLAMGAVADGRLLGRNGTTIGGVTVSTGLTLAAGALSVDTTTIATVAAVAAGYQPLDADLTALAALGDGLPYRSSGTWATSTGYRDALAGSYGTPGSANTYVTTTDPRLGGTAGPSGGATAIAAYGQGRDGTAAFDGTSAVTGWSRSGTTYTYTGTDDLHYTAVTISTGVTLKIEGFRFRCRSLAAGDNVTFSAAGASASGITAGTGAMPAAISSSIAGATFYGGEDGAAGRTTNAGGLGAPGLSVGALRGGGLGGNGGRARLTAIASISGGGASGSGTEATTKPWYSGDAFDILLSGLPFYRNGTAIAQIAGGTGGGGGPLTPGQGSSGGGGGSGGVIGFAAATASFGTGCSFNVDGGAGGNAAVTPATNTVAGGGGGGGGGLGCCVIGEVTGSNVPTFYARGGAGGNASLDGTGLWAEGGNGGSGGYWYVYFGTSPATPTMTCTGGAGGTNQGSGSGYTGSAAGSAGAGYYGTGS